MIRNDIEVTRVYEALENSKAEISIFRGGTGSSKSYSAAQYFIIKKLCGQTGKIIVIARKTLPALRKTAYRETLALIDKYKIPYKENRTELEYRINGNILYFLSVDNPEKIKSLNTDDVWLEEPTEFSFEDFMQFYLRLQGQIYLTFNPIDANHWIKKELIDSGNYDVFEDVSTYKDNPFLSEARRKRIENLINIDENFYKIYNLGQWGILKNIIYENWKTFRKISDYDKKPQEISYGIDWGYESPCSLVKIYWFDGEKVIWEELIYQEHLLIPDFIKLAKERIAEEEKDTDKQTAYLQKELRKEFYAGTDEPDSIQQFHNAGFNIHKANTDVRDGINFCKAHLIGLIGANIIKEAQGYKRKEDKNGNVLEEPVKFMDHSMDAGRYGTYSRIKGKPATAKTSTISFR